MSRTIEQIQADYETALLAESYRDHPGDMPGSLYEYLGLSEMYRGELLCAIVDNIPLARIEAICAAEREGRCIVLPCKVGDTVYWTSNFGKAIHHGKITALKISGFGIDLEIATPANLLFRCEAETVFLTREEAEAALKEAGKSE